MYEFIIGLPPFHGESPDIIFSNILMRKIVWPEIGD